MLGARADANSGGEIEVALRAGFAPGDIVFTGVGKTHDELDRAVALGLDAINAESPGEIDRIAAHRAARHAPRARVAIRINPDVDAESHPHISTGHHATKFGVTVAEAARCSREHRRAGPRSHVVGLHVHVGSQITTTEPLARAASRDRDARARTARTRARARASRPRRRPRHCVPARGHACSPSTTTRRRSCRAIRPTGLTLVLEPGRWLVGPAGVLVTTVVDLKPRPGGGWFVIVDAGMTDLLRPALYGAWHAIEAVRRAPARRSAPTSSGPCARPPTRSAPIATLPPIEVGDLLAIRDTGAYGAVMASNYNRRPMAAEVLVDARSMDDRAPPADDRRYAAVGCVMLIAFEGLDQSGKETQARLLRARLEQDGRKVHAVSFPDYETPIGQEIAARSHGERDFAPDVMQLLYVANRFEFKPRLDSWLADGERRRLRPLPRVERRVRRSAGPRPRVARGHPAPPAAGRSDGAARHRARDRRAAQDGPAAIGTSATCALLARVRESYRRQAAQHGWILIDGEQSERRGRRGGRAGGPATARAAVSARTLLAPARTSTRAHASSVAPVVITSSTSTTIAAAERRPSRHRRGRGARTRRATLALPARRRQAGLRRTVAGAAAAHATRAGPAARASRRPD